jgi:polysaccharide biosynthesis/export protein
MQGRVLLVVLAAIANAGCSYMPTNGPADYDVRSGPGRPDSLPYGFVKITPPVLGILADNEPRLGTAFANRRVPSEIRFGVGDVVSVTIFEAAAGGLFIPSEAGVRPGNFITLPNQAVDNNGNISVPYTSGVRAKGLTPPQVAKGIVDALKNRAIEPQAVVALVDQRTSLVSVLGDVNKASRFPASAAGERLLDAITRAGGPKNQGFDEWVMLERDGRREIIPFGALVYEPVNNIYVRPNDTVFLYREPQTFVAFGATGLVGGKQGQYAFDAWRISLAEAIAKAEGLDDSRAEPKGVFLYRGESRAVAEQLGVNVLQFDSPVIPIVYNLDLRDPAGYFLASKFQVRNKDVLYVSNATTSETAKFLNYVRLVTATINDPILYATNGYILRNTIQGTSAAASIAGGTGTAAGGGAAALPTVTP